MVLPALAADFPAAGALELCASTSLIEGPWPRLR
jgi:hypothetical protein